MDGAPKRSEPEVEIELDEIPEPEVGNVLSLDGFER
jgi:hypothetical protein